MAQIPINKRKWLLKLALTFVNEEEAEKSLELFREMADLNNES